MEAPCLVNLDLPPAQVPLQLFQGLLGGIGGQVGQQQPFDGRLAGGRMGLAGQDGGDFHLGGVAADLKLA
jgi:hypothetical protein